MISLAAIYSAIRKGQEAIDQIVWTYAGKDISDEDIKDLEKLSKALDTIMEALLEAIAPEDLGDTK
jgi:hypothetical protein